jgi:hypothetical protein
MAKQAVIILAVVLVFGILVPYYKGLEFLDPVVILVYACMSLLFVVRASAEIFAATEPVARAEITSRFGMILAYGWGTTVMMLLSGIVTVNVTHWHGHVLLPSSALLGSAVLLSLIATVAVISGTALLARRVGAQSAKSLLRVSFLLLLLLGAFGFRYLPADWRATIDRHTTTAGLVHFSLWASAVFAIMAMVFVPRLLRGTPAQNQ